MSSSTDNLVTLGLIGIGAYLAYKAYQLISGGAGAVANATQAAGTAVGSSVFNLLHPNPTGNTQYYTATLPSGQNTAVPASAVNSDGTVTVAGTQYQMMTDPSITSGVNKTLVPLNQTQLDNQAAADQFAMGFE